LSDKRSRAGPDSRAAPRLQDVPALRQLQRLPRVLLDQEMVVPAAVDGREGRRSPAPAPGARPMEGSSRAAARPCVIRARPMASHLLPPRRRATPRSCAPPLGQPREKGETRRVILRHSGPVAARPGGQAQFSWTVRLANSPRPPARAPALRATPRMRGHAVQVPPGDRSRPALHRHQPRTAPAASVDFPAPFAPSASRSPPRALQRHAMQRPDAAIRNPQVLHFQKGLNCA